MAARKDTKLRIEHRQAALKVSQQQETKPEIEIYRKPMSSSRPRSVKNAYLIVSIGELPDIDLLDAQAKD